MSLYAETDRVCDSYQVFYIKMEGIRLYKHTQPNAELEVISITGSNRRESCSVLNTWRSDEFALQGYAAEHFFFLMLFIQQIFSNRILNSFPPLKPTPPGWIFLRC